jgi:hypothetical protein
VRGLGELPLVDWPDRLALDDVARLIAMDA